MKTKWTIAVLTAMLMTSVTITRGDVIWPADNDWTALTIGAGFYHDVLSDQAPTSVDLIGTADSYSAGFWALVENGDITGGVTNDALMVRMRVGAESGNYVWQAHLDTDGDGSNIEYILQLVQSGNPSSQNVRLVKTTTSGPTLGDIDVANGTVADWGGSLSLYSRWTAIPASTDFYVDLAIPWNEFTTITGVSSLDQIRTVLATSSTHAGINKDAPLGGTLATQISDALSNTIPEPTVVSLLLGAGGGLLAYRRVFQKQSEADAEDLA